MTNNIRVFLWMGLGLALWLNYQQWLMVYGPKPQPQTAATNTAPATHAPVATDTVPQAAQPGANPAPTPATSDAIPGNVAVAPTPAVEAPSTAGKVRVTTDVLILDIDL